jgi:hypothetical protein
MPCVVKFDFHTPPPIMQDEQYTSVRSMCVNEKKFKTQVLTPNPRKAFFRGFRQKTADAKTAKAHILYAFYVGALRCSG